MMLCKGEALQAFHVVITTHNSRTSQRMIKYGVHRGPAVQLGLIEEILFTRIIRDIVIENGYQILASNICKDHVHILPVCEAEALTHIIQKIKSVSSKLFHRLNTPRGHDPLDRNHDPLDRGHDPLDRRNIKHLWSQKFYRAALDEWQLASLSTIPGYIYKTSHLSNAVSYIKTNREKHGLPLSDELEILIREFIVDEDIAFCKYSKGSRPLGCHDPLVSRRTNWISQPFDNSTARFRAA
jgi:REP element-mobilizing transposase RayT